MKNTITNPEIHRLQLTAGTLMDLLDSGRLDPFPGAKLAAFWLESRVHDQIEAEQAKTRAA